MFNWLYASIGVALGVAGGTFNGVIVYILIIGFLIFSTSFGIQWGLIALGEIAIGYLISNFIK
ncbi:hypothetical protein OAH81_01285 [Candidatus Pseudothioglobus singularis]|jgi:hypothetical protein|nr:hypothetical protein [Candidatus Pseudothioglobus singularis]MDB4821656.1 hypothetical protein [Candidatus Pseudothioglobus singularis]